MGLVWEEGLHSLYRNTLDGCSAPVCTCRAKSQMDQQLVPGVPGAWVLLDGNGEQDGGADEEDNFFFLSLPG